MRSPSDHSGASPAGDLPAGKLCHTGQQPTPAVRQASEMFPEGWRVNQWAAVLCVAAHTHLPI